MKYIISSVHSFCVDICLLAVVGFHPTAYTITEGVNATVSLTVTRLSGNKYSQVNNLLFTTISGTANGKCSKLLLYLHISVLLLTAFQNFHKKQNTAVFNGSDLLPQIMQLHQTNFFAIILPQLPVTSHL